MRFLRTSHQLRILFLSTRQSTFGTKSSNKFHHVFLFHETIIGSPTHQKSWHKLTSIKLVAKVGGSRKYPLSKQIRPDLIRTVQAVSTGCRQVWIYKSNLQSPKFIVFCACKHIFNQKFSRITSNFLKYAIPDSLRPLHSSGYHRRFPIQQGWQTRIDQKWTWRTEGTQRTQRAWKGQRLFGWEQEEQIEGMQKPDGAERQEGKEVEVRLVELLCLEFLGKGYIEASRLWRILRYTFEWTQHWLSFEG